ncbi:MAG: glucose-6-phosphate isomerase [Candidatus Ornithospirochaeta sp.]|nr:glucose-6-phosphate isomerase [Candidatus Ornithospirochaeta sp.]
MKISIADHGSCLKAEEAYRRIMEGEDEFRDSLGWFDPGKWAGDRVLSRLDELASGLSSHSSVLVVIGIGGSNQGARALIDSIHSDKGVDIIWAGNTLSSYEFEHVVSEIGDRDFSIDVIAKNFQTLEPGVTFRLFRKLLEKKYGNGYSHRVFVTGTRGSELEKLCIDNGWTWLDFPSDIGGRYSVLSPVGLFPIAASGLDIHAFASGAIKASDDIASDPSMIIDYASMRYESYMKGFSMEMLSFFEPRLYRFSRWWTQLMAESEGKEGKALFPVAGSFSEDLHSIGQFIQEGSKTIIETFIKVSDGESRYPVPMTDIEDGFRYLDGKTLEDINKVAEDATIKAHSSVLPVNVLEIERIDEFNLGYLMMYFMRLCYLSGRVLGINPFDQNGVEEYKRRMFKGLGKS